MCVSHTQEIGELEKKKGPDGKKKLSAADEKKLKDLKARRQTKVRSSRTT